MNGLRRFGRELVAKLGEVAFELGAISELHQSLAATKPAQLLNFHRAPLDEESNKPYTPAAGATFRALPVEVAFSGPERSIREFINSLQNSKTHFYLIRSMRVMNEKQAAPKASDVQFDEKKAGGKAADAPGGGIFDSGDAFVLPDEAPAPAGEAPAAPAAASVIWAVPRSKMSGTSTVTRNASMKPRSELREFKMARNSARL